CESSMRGASRCTWRWWSATRRRAAMRTPFLPLLSLPSTHATSFFSPMPSYGPNESLKLLVRELHARGIEVHVEVVVSHTAEGSDEDPKPISFRGIDNRAYYINDPYGKQ
ncbi:unnamed protein product, partial [Closterium sp. NIES-54]